VCVSDIVHQSVADRFREPFRDMGRQRVKNISRPIRVWQWTPDASKDEKKLAEAALHQRVRFAMAPDGVQIAWGQRRAVGIAVRGGQSIRRWSKLKEWLESPTPSARARMFVELPSWYHGG
jgi:hypothetical protein